MRALQYILCPNRSRTINVGMIAMINAPQISTGITHANARNTRAQTATIPYSTLMSSIEKSVLAFLFLPQTQSFVPVLIAVSIHNL